jgi:hypothetical protein
VGEKVREVVAYAITHAPKGVKGGPYEAALGAEPVASLEDAWRTPAGTVERARSVLRTVRRYVPTARVIRIVRKARPSEAVDDAPSEVTQSHLRALAERLESRPCAPSLDGYDLADGLRAAADLLAGESGPSVHRDAAAGGRASPRVSLATYAGLAPSQQPSEAEAVAVLRDMFATWDARGIICVAAFDRARRVLAGAGPDPMPVVRAAMAYWESGGSMSDMPLLTAVDAYRKAGGK